MPILQTQIWVSLISVFFLIKIRLFLHALAGLDPARPLVRSPNRLRNVDANVVQVIHTNAGLFGEDAPLGIVDFCVNGGRQQPTCENNTRKYLATPNRCPLCMSDQNMKVTLHRGIVGLAEYKAGFHFIDN
jgi:hypothetical protein